jgi:hypothetical protein
MSASILVRKLDANGDPVWGNGQLDFVSDSEAVQQLTQTRLLMFQGEYWANKQDGLPLWQSILGVPENTQAISLVIQKRILGTAFVTGLQNLSVNFNRQQRSYSFSVEENTQFGKVQLTNIPTVPPQGLP